MLAPRGPELVGLGREVCLGESRHLVHTAASLEEPILLSDDPALVHQDMAARVLGSLRAELGSRGRMLYLAVGGSYAYGTATPQSDVDFRGAFAHGLSNLVSLDAPLEGVNRTDPDDVQADSLKRVIGLALQGKFSMAEMLFVPRGCVLFSDPAMDHLLERKEALLSKLWFKGILGYFEAQAKSLASKGTGSNLGRMRTAYTCGPPGEPEEQFDGKFALHAIRLGNVGLDLAEQGRVVVRRPEAEFLLQVRNGVAFSGRTEVVSYLRDLERRLKVACERSGLRDEPDRALWNGLYREVENACG